MIVDFVFDIASPNTYLAHKIIPDFESRTGAKFNYIPSLLGGIQKLTNNQPPFIAYADCKNKTNYQMIEIERFIKLHNIENYKFNSHFPPNTVQVQRGAIAAQELNIFEQYFECVIKAMWEYDKNISDVEVLKSLNYSVLILTPRFNKVLAIIASTIIIEKGTRKAFHSSTVPIPKKPNLNASIM